MSSSPHFYFITLFPETIETWLTTSIMGRAHEHGLFRYTLLNLRPFGTGRHRSVDDVSYGGGGGMVLRIEPLVAALESLSLPKEKTRIICFSPGGRRLDQGLIDELGRSTTENFVLLCGRYEGIDQRFIDGWVDLEISLGDFVLTGGELPAVALADALVRQIDGALGGRTHASTEESFRLTHPEIGRLVEYPHYTRPAEFRGHVVPEVLLQGDHEAVKAWRTAQSVERTRRRSDS